MAVSHAEFTTPDGRDLWIHKQCEPDTREFFRKETATLGKKTGNLAEQFYNENT